MRNVCDYKVKSWVLAVKILELLEVVAMLLKGGFDGKKEVQNGRRVAVLEKGKRILRVSHTYRSTVPDGSNRAKKQKKKNSHAFCLYLS